MNRATAAVLIALAFTAGNIAATSAGTIVLKHKGTTAQPAAGMNLQAKPFPANCVSGLQKYDEKKVNVAGVPVTYSFSCRTAWIECPTFPAYTTTLLDYDVKQQGGVEGGGRIRFTYTCSGFTPEG